MEISINKITSIANKIFQKVGLSQADAEIITKVLAETEMRGVFTHGFIRLSRYVDCILSGGIHTDGNYSTITDTPSWALIDGNQNLGIVISYKAALLAIEKAKETGIGVVNVRNSHHFGAAGYYASMCADQNMIGLAMSNGDVLIAATGSKTRTIGNNPFAYSYPAGKYGKIVYDIAMSHTSDQKVIKNAREGKPIPSGWIIDKDGNPTTDATKYEEGGTLLPFGGYKGYGMAMMVETLAAITSGAAVTNDVHAWNTNPEKSGNTGHVFIAMDLSKIGDPKEFAVRTEHMIDEIKSAPKAQGVDTIYFPGEIESNKLKSCLNNGKIDIADSTIDAIYKTAEKIGCKL
jgi:LDH2 family malate/lactate/ureidoglycolate dehydrogenase